MLANVASVSSKAAISMVIGHNRRRLKIQEIDKPPKMKAEKSKNALCPSSMYSNYPGDVNKTVMTFSLMY